MQLHGDRRTGVPKQVDHEERRRHIAAALLGIIVDQGLEAASLRDVAAAAGVSMGAVQHYFESKDEMLRFALQYNHELLTRRVLSILAASPEPDTIRAALRMVLVELLPLDEASRAGTRLGAAILARGAVDPAVAAIVEMAYAGVIGFLVRHLRLARERGELPDDLDLDRAARSLYAVVDGLRWAALFDAYPREEVLAILDDHLTRLFG
jgi:TetR/AcrR family transcriptional regulator, transcriptional repressor of bet genes